LQKRVLRRRPLQSEKQASTLGAASSSQPLGELKKFQLSLNVNEHFGFPAIP
jgi:hypothetical protein